MLSVGRLYVRSEISSQGTTRRSCLSFWSRLDQNAQMKPTGHKTLATAFARATTDCCSPPLQRRGFRRGITSLKFRACQRSCCTCIFSQNTGARKDMPDFRPSLHLAPNALAMRLSVDGLYMKHSLIRMTVHPSRLRDRETRRSLRLLFSILSLQNFVLVRGRYLQRQPCQKQPSTNTAILRAGHAKSGFPSTSQCLR